MLSAGGVLFAVPVSAQMHPQVTCSIDWASGVSGLWTDASKWSPARVPTSSDDVCITVSGTYSVTLNGSATVDSLTLGGSSGVQTFVDQGTAANGAALLAATAGGSIGANGVFEMDSTNGNFALVSGGTFTNSGLFETVQDAGGVRYLRAPISNSGTVSIGSNDTVQDTGTLDTNSGSFTVTSTGILNLSTNSGFTDSGGSLTVTGSMTENTGTFTQSGGTESGNAVVVISAAFVDSVGTGSFVLEGSCSLSGTIPSGQTVTVLGTAAQGAASAAMNAAVTNNGSLILDSSNGNYSLIGGTGTLTNNGAFKAAATAGGTRYVRVNLVNAATGTVEIAEPGTVQDTGITDTNSGTFTIDPAGTLALSSGSSFTNSAGTLAVNGSYTESGGTFTQSGGTDSGNAVVLINASLADSTGTASFELEGSCSLSGTIPAGQTVTILGTAAQGAASTTMNAAVTNNGSLVLDSSNGNYALIEGTGTLTNNASLKSAATAGGQRFLRVNLVNAASGTVEIAEPGTVDDEGFNETNNGTFTVDAAGTFALSGGGSFTSSAGTLTVNGSFSQSGATYTESGGAESGNPVLLTSATLADSAGTGSFDLEASDTLTGSIPAGQTVTTLGTAAQGGSVLSISGTVTNNGTLAMSSSNGNYSILSGASTPTISNNGLFQLQQAAGGSRYLRVNVTNNSGGTFDIASAGTIDDQGFNIVNNGLMTIDDGAHLPFTGASSFTNGSTGTFGATVDATNGTFGLTGGTAHLGGTLQITTVGSPGLGTTHTPISGSTVTGTFSGLQYGANEYATAYSGSAVTLTTGTPFTVTAKTIHAVDETPATLTLATVTDSAPTPPYTVTVNWGDSTSSAGTFTTTGTGGKAKGTHTWTAPGVYTVQTTVHAADGTTITVSKNITVAVAPVPTVTSVSPTVGLQGKNVTLTVNGTGFTVNSVPSFSDAGISVTSTTWNSTSKLTVHIAISAGAATGAGNVLVTTPGGVGTCTGCFTVDAPPTITRVHPDPVHGATTTVTVTGTGFQAGLVVTTTITGATLGAPSGITSTSFTIAITVPAGTSPGNYTVTVTNTDGGKATHRVTVT